MWRRPRNLGLVSDHFDVRSLRRQILWAASHPDAHPGVPDDTDDGSCGSLDHIAHSSSWRQPPEHTDCPQDCHCNGRGYQRAVENIGLLHRSWRAAPLNGWNGIAVVVQPRRIDKGRCDGNHRIADWPTEDGRQAVPCAPDGLRPLFARAAPGLAMLYV